VALKSIIDIDIDDSKFQRFKGLFDRYDAQLAKMPDLWKKAGVAQDAIASNFQRMATAMLAVSQLNRENLETGAEQTTQLSKSEGLWTSIARSSRTVLGNVVSAGEGLLKWTGILGVVGGLLGGAAGIFGIDRMAGGVARDRRASMGLGMSIGGYKAFNIDMGRLLDTQAFLGNVGAMETDLTQQTQAYAFLGHGLTGNTGADATQLLQAYRALALSTSTNLLGPAFVARGANLDPGDLRRLQSMSPAEFQKQINATAADTKRMDIPDKAALAWTNLITQLERAGAVITKVFVNALLPLEPSLEKLSVEFVKVVQAFMTTDTVKAAITKLAGWLDSFSSALKDLPATLANLNAFAQVITHPLDSYKSWAGGVVADVAEWIHPSKSGVMANKASYTDYLGRQASFFGVPQDMLTYQWQRESGSTLFPPNNKGHVGPFQFDPRTAAWLNQKMNTHFDPTDPAGAARLAAAYDNWLLNHFQGNMQEALAGYRAGPAAVDTAIAKGGKDWLQQLPKEYQDYVTRYDPTGRVNITVISPTGASPVPVANQLQ
jgi:hypothetical protein